MPKEHTLFAMSVVFEHVYVSMHNMCTAMHVTCTCMSPLQISSNILFEVHVGNTVQRS